MTVSCRWDWRSWGHQVYYDSDTYETLKTTHPLWFREDFLGATGGGPFDGTARWKVIDVGDATEAVVADSENGEFLLHLAATDEAEDAVLYMNDNKTFCVTNGLVFEAKIDIAVAPGDGGGSPVEPVCMVAGMAGDHNLDKDSITEHAWFRWDASMACKAESDDTTNNNDDKSTGITTVAGTYNIFMIDFTTITDVKFYIDGTQVATGTTFDMSNLSAAEAQMQPYFSIDKASGTGLGDMKIDYVKIFSNRS